VAVIAANKDGLVARKVALAAALQHKCKCVVGSLHQPTKKVVTKHAATTEENISVSFSIRISTHIAA
jgi:hypothetical protein